MGLLRTKVAPMAGSCSGLPDRDGNLDDVYAGLDDTDHTGRSVSSLNAFLWNTFAK